MINTKTPISGLTEEDILALLGLPSSDSQITALIEQSESLSRSQFGRKGYVFAQFGLNYEPCSLNCKFCSLAEENFAFDRKTRLSPPEAVARIREQDLADVSDLFLMSTADYPFADVLEIGRNLRLFLPADKKLVANIGDFNAEQAEQLAHAGFTGFYHIVRLREGIDTKGDPEVREDTIEQGVRAGLELYYCIEPIGPEHRPEEIALEILRAQKLRPAVMAVMRRVGIPGSSLYAHGELSDEDLAKIVAVTNLAVRPERAMNVHEPCVGAMKAGVNQLYAELGSNPRDVEEETEKNRGFSVNKAWTYLEDMAYFPAR